MNGFERYAIILQIELNVRGRIVTAVCCIGWCYREMSNTRKFFNCTISRISGLPINHQVRHIFRTNSFRVVSFFRSKNAMIDDNCLESGCFVA